MRRRRLSHRDRDRERKIVGDLRQALAEPDFLLLSTATGSDRADDLPVLILGERAQGLAVAVAAGTDPK